MQRKLLVGLMTASAQQKIVETQYYKTNPALGGDVTIENSTKETKGDLSYTTFEVNTLKSGLYNLNMWILPSQLADGSVSSYAVNVNGEMLKSKVAPETGEIQSYMLNEKVVLKSGKNTVSFIAKAPEVAEIEFIRLSPSETKAFISSEKFDNYMKEINELNAASASKMSKQERIVVGPPVVGPPVIGPPVLQDTSFFLQPNYTINSLYNYGYKKNITYRYTYFRTVNLTAGQTFFVATNGINKFGHYLELFSSSNPQDYTWNSRSNSDGLASLNITIPVTGLYYVMVRSSKNAALGSVNININGQYYYPNVPAFSVGYLYHQDTEREYNSFTAQATSDPRIWIERSKSIVGFNDDWNKTSDFNWGRNSRVKQFYKSKVHAVLVSAYSSSTPVGTCNLYVGCRNSTVYPYFENLKADDAIMSAPASGVYNCISWSGGITDYWEWPPVPFSDYYQGTPLASFDYFYGTYRYGKRKPTNPKEECTIYSRSGATAANSLIDLWAIVNGTSKEYTHASVSGEANGHHHGYDWESKPGSLMRTFHPRNALRGNSYGQVVAYYRPVAIAYPYSLSQSIADGSSVLENVQFTDLEKAVLKAEIDNMALSQKSTFETKYAAWKATWAESPYSDMRRYENSQFTDLLNYCKPRPDLNYLVYSKLGEGDFLNLLLVDKLTLTNNVANNQMLDRIKLSNSNNVTTSSGATIVRSPYSNSMLYVKNLISGSPRMQAAKRSMDSEDDNTTGITYSNTDDVSVRSNGNEIGISFTLSKDAKVFVSILELSGLEIKPVVRDHFVAGQYDYTTTMDKPGMYLVRIEINGNVNVKKITIR